MKLTALKLIRRPQSFTLIELLVVISIIAILATITVPSVTGALTKGHLLEGLANCRAIQQATYQASIEAEQQGQPGGWPKDSEKTSLTDWVSSLVGGGYLKPSDLRIFAAAGIPKANTLDGFSDKNCAFNVGIVSSADDDSMVFLKSKNFETWGQPLASKLPFSKNGFVYYCKNGYGMMANPPMATNLATLGTNVPAQWW